MASTSEQPQVPAQPEQPVAEQPAEPQPQIDIYEQMIIFYCFLKV